MERRQNAMSKGLNDNGKVWKGDWETPGRFHRDGKASKDDGKALKNSLSSQK